MVLAINKYDALFVFSSPNEATSYLEAIDVQQDLFEFCDDEGQRYGPNFIIPPRVSRLGLIDIGAFELVPEGSIDSQLPSLFMGRAAHLEHTFVSRIHSLEALREELRKRV